VIDEEVANIAKVNGILLDAFKHLYLRSLSRTSKEFIIVEHVSSGQAYGWRAQALTSQLSDVDNVIVYEIQHAGERALEEVRAGKDTDDCLVRWLCGSISS